MGEYRSFRLLKYSPPEKTAANYSESEKNQFQESFKRRARDYRIFKYVVLGLFLVFAFALIKFSRAEEFYLSLTFVCTYVFLYLLFRPLCPACSRNVMAEVKIFCPECGSDRISPGGFMRAKECLSCGEVLRQGKGRSYKVRRCTHCGVFLDAKGL